MLDGLLKALGGARFAIILLLALTAWCTIGSAVPQEGRSPPQEIEAWQMAHPWTGALLDQVGGFHAFRAPLFILLLGLLFLNIAACTVYHLWKGEAYRKALTERIGFILVHLSLLGLITGGMMSAALKWDANVWLIEGQTLHNKDTAFAERTPRTFDSRPVPTVQIGLNTVIKEYAETHYTVKTASDINLNQTSNIFIEVNRPYREGNLFITQDETGYAPGIKIIHTKSGRTLVDSWLALRFDRNATTNRHMDIIPSGRGLPELVFTLYPDHTIDGTNVLWSGEAPLNPILHVVSHKQDKRASFIKMNQAGRLGPYTISFNTLRRWSKFRVMDDPGYAVITWSLWLSLAALLMRYLPGVIRWLRTPMM